jgi:hypothetical protein
MRTWLSLHGELISKWHGPHCKAALYSSVASEHYQPSRRPAAYVTPHFICCTMLIRYMICMNPLPKFATNLVIDKVRYAHDETIGGDDILLLQ